MGPLNDGQNIVKLKGNRARELWKRIAVSDRLIAADRHIRYAAVRIGNVDVQNVEIVADRAHAEFVDRAGADHLCVVPGYRPVLLTTGTAAGERSADRKG